MEYKRYIFLTVMLLLLSSCATKPHYIEGKVMPKDIDVLVNAIDVQPFRGNYGSQFSSQLETTIKREGFVDVLTNGAPFTLRGNLDIGWIKSDSYLDK
ncbi:MAG: hypothetical protein VSS52_006240, partial [Thiotrichaceae bacterium]|nr:hypothetical protein [Thiotrichaceae bacterium]